VRERAVSRESCNLIGSGSGQNFPISDHGHGNHAKAMNENSNSKTRLNSESFSEIFGYKMRIFHQLRILTCVVSGKSNKEGN